MLSEAIGCFLCEEIEQDNKPIVLYGNKENIMMAVMIGALKSGRAYIPIDISYPKERVDRIIEEVKPDVLFDFSEGNTFNDIRVICNSDIKVIYEKYKETTVDNGKWVKGDENAYILFTSGSTGKPKGVQISSNNLDNFVEWIGEYLNLDDSEEILEKKVCKKLKIDKNDINKLIIIKKSIDARKKHDIKFNYCLDVICDKEKKILSKIHDKDVKFEEIKERELITKGDIELESRPVVVGFGPAGIFAALTLAREGYKPVVYERGEDVDKRTETVDKFWKTGKLDTESNVQFGEGGAGTFSDGKLTTRIKDFRCTFVLDELIKAGAPDEIKYESKAHVGTDLLKDVVKNIREEIKSLGGEVHFSSKVEKIEYEDGKLKYIVVNGEKRPCQALVLAIGHSSRDTYEMLNEKGVSMEAKAFAIGVRIEHPQEVINFSQYGESYNHPKLHAADYRLTYQSERLKRGVYSFCMCPGGVVVAASSEHERLVSNGMSYHARESTSSTCG